MLGKFALGWMSALFMAGTTSAQSTLQVTPDGLTAGSSAEISFSDPSLANQTVLVEIDDGGVISTRFEYVTVQLDSNGNGSGSWTVPESGWRRANFNAPNSKTVSLRIYRPKKRVL